MLRCLYLFLLLCLAASPVAAQSAIGQNRCSELVNTTPYKVRGSVQTDVTTLPDGTKASHKANYTIPAGERWQICSSGPFFEGERVELVIRTLFPVFTCKTQLGQPIAITATRNADDNGYDWRAACR